jgi:hypothetical protein
MSGVRSVFGGYFARSRAGRTGRRSRLPPHVGQCPSNRAAQSTQNVHSNVHIIAESESGGRSRLQHSQLGRRSSMRCIRIAFGEEMDVRFLRKSRWPERPPTGHLT